GAGRGVTKRDPDPVFEALADPTRRAMIEALADDGPTTLSDLTRRLPVTRQAVAKHLVVLQDAGLVEGSGPVRGRMYSFTPQPLRPSSPATYARAGSPSPTTSWARPSSRSFGTSTGSRATRRRSARGSSRSAGTSWSTISASGPAAPSTSSPTNSSSRRPRSA